MEDYTKVGEGKVQDGLMRFCAPVTVTNAPRSLKRGIQRFANLDAPKPQAGPTEGGGRPFIGLGRDTNQRLGQLGIYHLTVIP